MTIIIVLAITGAGVVTGLLFAFSNFVIRALDELPNEKGMFAMQQINKKIINPVFMLLFLGTPVLCVLITINTILNIGSFNDLILLLGAVSYLIGPFGVTMLFNVPMNNQLANAALSTADNVWPRYQKRWQKWNHIRTYIGVVSIILLSIGLGAEAS